MPCKFSILFSRFENGFALSIVLTSSVVYVRNKCVTPFKYFTNTSKVVSSFIFTTPGLYYGIIMSLTNINIYGIHVKSSIEFGNTFTITILCKSYYGNLSLINDKFLSILIGSVLYSFYNPSYYSLLQVLTKSRLRKCFPKNDFANADVLSLSKLDHTATS